ncbi:hypothetical protein AQ932_11935 [Burkholderia pseudomallei]|nr:hypothetical protein AQ933_16310 [Burkholderia pseudomallei]OND51465.1 hypothetical protein AQ932_11935 [Burkholderia pseudomallei]
MQRLPLGLEIRLQHHVRCSDIPSLARAEKKPDPISFNVNDRQNDGLSTRSLHDERGTEFLAFEVTFNRSDQELPIIVDATSEEFPLLDLDLTFLFPKKFAPTIKPFGSLFIFGLLRTHAVDDFEPTQESPQCIPGSSVIAHLPRMECYSCYGGVLLSKLTRSIGRMNHEILN